MIIGKRVLEGKTTTPAGYPLPLSGKALTDTPVVDRTEGAQLKEYPEVYIPGQEELGVDEIRLTCIGSGNPPVRRAQAATGWLVELGNGEKFVFDVGGGTVQNLWSLMIHPALLDKLFLTHLHQALVLIAWWRLSLNIKWCTINAQVFLVNRMLT